MRVINKLAIGWSVILLLWTCCAGDVRAMSANRMEESVQTDGPRRIGAIVIDDFGDDMKGTAEMMEVELKFTAAIMPFQRTTRRDAEWAHQLGHDVIIHMPMEPKHGGKRGLGPGAITTGLTDEEIRERLEAAIANVPYAVGMNNHMGSKATGDVRVMRIVLQVCKEHGLFFLDSKTNYRSVTAKVAKELGVPTIDNHLFFDDVVTIGHITKQVRLMERHLNEHNVCIAIGHVGNPGKKTAEVLKRLTPELNAKAKFVGLKQLISQQGAASGFPAP